MGFPFTAFSSMSCLFCIDIINNEDKNSKKNIETYQILQIKPK